MKKMKRLSYILLSGLMLILSACEKDTESSNFAPVVTTGTASNIYRMGATLSGSIQLTETNTAQSYGILLSSFESMAEATEYPVKDGSSNYNVLVQNLEPGETYYYCAYASSGYSTAKSQIKSFTTTNSNAPVFNEVILQSKDEKSCAVSVELLDEGGSELLMTGFVWGEAGSGDPTIKSNVANVEPQGNRLSATIKGMEPNKTYLVRAYGVNAQGVGYSSSISVTTNTATVPFLSNITRVDSTEVSVTVKASVLDAGLGEVSKYGFCYSSESKNPTTDHLVVGNIAGDSKNFSALIDGLKPETTYYIRAYAINEKGTGYSETFVYATPEPTLIEGNEGDVNVAEPGGLSKFIDDTNKYNITTLKVSGYLNGDDIRLIREMAGRDVNGNETLGRLVDLDISEATIVEGGGAYLMTEWDALYTANNIIGAHMFQGTILENFFFPKVTTIEKQAFDNCIGLVKVNVPEGVIEIKDGAFVACENLISAYLPETLITIGEGVFYGCSNLNAMDIPNGVISIGLNAFAKCSSLQSIVIPNGVTSISEGTFWDCTSLTTVSIPESVTSIGPGVFSGCKALKSIVIPDAVTEIENHTFDQCTSLIDIILPTKLLAIGDYAFQGCTALPSITIPESVVIIGSNAFSACHALNSITIPNNVTKINNRAFAYCSALTNVILSESLTEIGQYAFSCCTSLPSITIPQNVVFIDAAAFDDCSALAEVTCKSTTPPNLMDTWTFDGIASPATLYVPSGCVPAYKASTWANYFSIIKAEGETDSGEGSFDDMPNIEW